MQGILAELQDFIYLLPAIVISLTVHEFSHAYVAHRLGDPTPKEDGRLSLNPLHHIDPMGFIVMLFVRFGWAKPVRINPLYFQNPRKGMLYTAIAGPISNLCLAVLSSLVLFLGIQWKAPFVFVRLFIYMVLLNVGLAVFNLIPVYPFDGSRVVSYFSPRYASFMASNADTVQLIFMAVLILPRFLPIPDLVGTMIGNVQSGLMQLLMWLWSTVFWFL
ncbi:MAG: site-2 protease family protein [Clostridia bacterium]|nr:site-2 protease family protein [Clostridia bacterium]